MLSVENNFTVETSMKLFEKDNKHFISGQKLKFFEKSNKIQMSIMIMIHFFSGCIETGSKVSAHTC